MPIYDYKCTDCAHTWDEHRKLGDHNTTCPKCGGRARHVFTPILFKFKRAKHKRQQPRVGEDQVYSRTYEPGQAVGDPMLDGGFERVE